MGGMPRSLAKRSIQRRHDGPSAGLAVDRDQARLLQSRQSARFGGTIYSERLKLGIAQCNCAFSSGTFQAPYAQAEYERFAP
jgi:hypothetical protein